MRDAPNRIIAWKERGPESGKKPLTEQEEKYCDLVISGMTQIEAIVEAGILPPGTPKEKLKSKTKALNGTNRIRRYMSENSKVIRIMTTRDYDIMRTHMYEIAIGTAIRKAKKITKDGEVVEYEESPSFRDQVSAAGWLTADLKLRNEKTANTPAQEIILRDIDEIEKKANALVEKYSFRRIAMDPKSEKALMRIEEENELARPFIDVEATEYPSMYGFEEKEE